MSANGPTGMSPPNSSAIIVSTHGTGSARAAHAVAYVECVCTTPPTWGMCVYTYACAAVSDDGARSPSTRFASRSHTTIDSGVSSSYVTPDGLMTSRSRSLGPAGSTTTRCDTLPAVHTTRPQRGSSACSALTFARAAATCSRTADG